MTVLTGRRLGRRAIVAGSVAACTLVAMAAGTGPASARSPAGPACGSSFDPYSYTAAQLRGCGFPVYPSLVARPLPAKDGTGGGPGISVQYQLGHGVTVEQLIPPRRFRPLTASAAVLDQYGFPPRPAGGPALADWTAEMADWRGSGPAAPFLTASPARTHAVSDTDISGNWAGYVAESRSRRFTQAEGWYYEPSAHRSRCRPADESTWAGLGGWKDGDKPLAQNGTAIGMPGMSDHQAWWEFWPHNNMIPIDFYATPGRVFDASVRYVGKSGGAPDEYRFWFHNDASGQTEAFNTFVSAADRGAKGRSGTAAYTAEMIIERPGVDDQVTNLTNFGSLKVVASRANGVGFGAYPPHPAKGLIRHGEHMMNGSTLLAVPGGISGDGAFTVTQKSCN